ncbi:CRISPR-associated endonuclease Cas1 [Endozoicomonas sp.]|uniref:CRISPR-associated endonuclease Cas1 n=1 Tax=Endozoicomonas sp. TaxID=1892382 RepID=UPI00383B8EC6
MSRQAPLQTIPLRRVETLVFLHSVSLPSRLISTAGELGIALVYINSHQLRRSFAIVPPGSVLANLRLKQLCLCGDQQQRIHWVRRGLQIKLHYLYKQAWRCHVRRPDHRRPLTRALGTIARCRQELLDAGDLDSLRGLEGKAQQAWFGVFQYLTPVSLGFTGRQRQPPPDPVNALLSLTYTQLYLLAWEVCLMVGLDPALGFFHEFAANRQSLACDLMEPLRPMAEVWVMQLFNQQVFRSRDFSAKSGKGCQLSASALKRYQTLFEQQRNMWKRLLLKYCRVYRDQLDQWEPQWPANNNG